MAMNHSPDFFPDAKASERCLLALTTMSCCKRHYFIGSHTKFLLLRHANGLQAIRH